MTSCSEINSRAVVLASFHRPGRGCFSTGPASRFADISWFDTSDRRRRRTVEGCVARRLVTPNGHSLHAAALRQIIVGGVVLHRAIVPDHQLVRLPLNPQLMLGYERLPEQKIQHGPALVIANAIDMSGEVSVDEKCPTSRFGVHSHHRVMGDGVFSLHSLKDRQPLGVVSQNATKATVPVGRCQPVEVRLHPVAQVFVGSRHAGEHGVAAELRRDPRTENGGHRGLGSEGLVAVPYIGERARRLAMVVQNYELWHFVGVGRKRTHREFAEHSTEGHMILGGDVLVGKDENLVFDESAADFVERTLVENAEIDVGHFGAEQWTEWFDLHASLPSYR